MSTRREFLITGAKAAALVATLSAVPATALEWRPRYDDKLIVQYLADPRAHAWVRQDYIYGYLYMTIFANDGLCRLDHGRAIYGQQITLSASYPEFAPGDADLIEERLLEWSRLPITYAETAPEIRVYDDGASIDIRYRIPRGYGHYIVPGIGRRG